MRFQVPQFIEVEDKLLGPLTFKQGVYLGGGIGIVVLLFKFLPTFVALLASVPVAVFSLALAFYKVNEKPFVNVVEAFFNYSFGPKLYIWKKVDRVAEGKTDKEREKPIEQIYVPKLSDSKLKDLSWSLDVQDQSNPVTRDTIEQARARARNTI